MKNKILFTVIILAFVAGVIFLIYPNLLGPGKNIARQDNAVRVAAIINMTGSAAQFDAIKAQTLEVAQNRLGSLYPEVSLELNILDAGSSPASTTIAVRKAIEQRSQFILSGTSPTALAIAAQVRDLNPPIWQLANAANPDFGPPRKHEIRFWPDWEQESKLVSDIITKEGFNSVLLIHSTDPYSEALSNALSNRLKSNVSVRAQQFDPASAPDFRPALLRSRNEADALVIFGLPPGIRALVTQLAEVGWEKPVIGGVNINLAVDDFRSAKVHAPLWLIETEAMRKQLTKGTEANAFRTAYEERFGNPPPFHALYLADALYLITAAANVNGEDPSKIDLLTVSSFDAPSGKVEVLPNGTLRFPMEAKRAL